jgi:hypothetical protein
VGLGGGLSEGFGGRSQRRRDPRARLALTPLAICAAAVAVSLAPAGVARAETTVEGSVGVNGYADQLGHVVVSVQVTADELVDGRLDVTHRGSPIVIRQDLQVPAGTTKDVRVLVPGPLFDGTLTVDVRDGDRLVATRDVRVRFDEDAELVGVLPRLVARGQELPEQATLDTDTGRAELAPLTTDVLDLGPAALDAYDTIAGTSDDLTALDAEQLRSVLLWVNAGGRLLLDDATTLDALPDSWRPGAAGYAWAGTGEVRVVDGAASRGEWASIIEPSTAAGSGAFGPEAFVDPETDLARRAGLRLPTLTPVIVTLAAYGFLIGPVVYLVLRRARRLTLGWVVIPIVAVVTAGGIVSAGGRYRSSGNPATAAFLDVSPAGSMATTNVLAFERGGGETTIDAPPGWTTDESATMWTGRREDTTRVQSVHADGTTVSMSLEAGQVSTNTLVGPADAVPFTVSATVTGDGRISGTVVNGTSVDLHDVAVFVGDRVSRIGTIGAGATATWDAPAPIDLQRFASRGDQAWQLPFEAGVDDQVAELGVWGTASMTIDLFTPGIVRAVAWTGELGAVVDLDREASTRTGLSATAPVDAAGAPLGAATVRATVVRTPFGPLGDGAGDEQVYRYLLPPGTPAEGLQLTSIERPTISELAVWDGSGWQTLDVDEDEPAVPPAAVREGVVLVRATVRNGADPGVLPVLEARA